MKKNSSLGKIIASLSYEEKIKYIASHSSPIEVLDNISEGLEIDGKLAIKLSTKIEIASNEKSSSYILEKMSLDCDIGVKTSVAMNLVTSPKVLKNLSACKNSVVREGVAINQNTPLSILKTLMKDENFLIREKVLKHRSTTMEMLEELSNDNDRNIKLAANRKLTILQIKDTQQGNIKWV